MQASNNLTTCQMAVCEEPLQIIPSDSCLGPTNEPAILVTVIIRCIIICWHRQAIVG